MTQAWHMPHDSAPATPLTSGTKCTCTGGLNPVPGGGTQLFQVRVTRQAAPIPVRVRGIPLTKCQGCGDEVYDVLVLQDIQSRLLALALQQGGTLPATMAYDQLGI